MAHDPNEVLLPGASCLYSVGIVSVLESSRSAMTEEHVDSPVLTSIGH